MILAYAGRRPGSDFPDANTEFVSEQIQRLIVGLRPRLAIGSAAAGGDLLVIEAATEAHVPVRALIAGDRAAFRTGSVSDKGRAWELKYDTQLDLPTVTVDPVPLVEGDDEASYRAVTKQISETAEAELKTEEELVILAVWNKREGEQADHTEELIAYHEARGRLVIKLDPARTFANSEPAFVAMPFGTRPYPEKGWKDYEADLSYARIITPALIDAGYRPVRADTDALLEVIDLTMLRHLNRAKLVIADLAMLNANVMWEVGLRHAWRRRGTVLIGPRWVKSPFDVARVPLHHYDRKAGRIDDKDAVTAIKKLRDVLADVAERNTDSPVFANLGPQAPDVELPEMPGAAESETSDLLAEISLAADLRRKGDLLAAAQRVRDAPDLEDSTRNTLLEQSGLALNSFGEHDEARKLLEPLADADKNYKRRHLQQQCAHAETRSKTSEWLGAAETRLNKVIKTQGGDSETYGLLGAVHKRQIEDALTAKRPPDPTHLDEAIEHYRSGFKSNPGDFYPGINAVALLRLRGQHFRKNDTDLDEARKLLPVVRFAVERVDDFEDDGWAQLTLADLALHQQLLGETPPTNPSELYAQAARLSDQQRSSARRQLTLLLDAGDPPEVINPLLETIG